VKLRVLKKRARRRDAHFRREYRRALDRHDRCGTRPTGRTERDGTIYELSYDSRLPEDPPHVVMSTSESGRWLRQEQGKSRLAAWVFDVGSLRVAEGDDDDVDE